MNEYNDGRINKLKVGLYQANILISKRSINNESDIILGEDTYFFVFIGLKCLILKNFI